MSLSLRLLASFTLLALTVTHTALANTVSYRCLESVHDALSQKRLQYKVIITSLGRESSPRVTHGYDAVERVRVELLSRDPRGHGAFGPDRPEFNALAKSQDVLTVIDSWKENGLTLTLYLDELDQSSLTLKGVKGHIQLTCR